MRQLFEFLLLYFLFIIQAGVVQTGPDFTMLALIFFALHEEKITSTLLGFFVGLCVDLTNPNNFGVYIIIFTLISYGISRLRNFFYRSRWQIVIFTLITLGVKTAIGAVTGNSKPHPASIITIILTLILSPWVEPLLRPLFNSKK